MSILSVAFRLEIAEGFDVPKIEFYSKGISKSYAEVTSGLNKKEVQVESKDLSKYKGKRKFSRFIIETYMANSSHIHENKAETDEAESVCGESPSTTLKNVQAYSEERSQTFTDETSLKQKSTIDKKDKEAGEKNTDSKNKTLSADTEFKKVTAEKTSGNNPTKSLKLEGKTQGEKSLLNKRTKGASSHFRKDRDLSKTEPQKEYKISEALKQDKQPLALQTLAKKASFEFVETEHGASGGEPEASTRTARSLSPAACSIPFSSGNPCVETTEGIIHLYRDNDLYPATGDDSPKSEMICFMGVPATMTSHDIIQFLAPVEDWIEHIKVIRDNTPNQYMLLVKFRTYKNALDFYKNFNNKPFNSVEKDLCQLAFVSRLEAVKSEEGAGLPIAGLVELPTCPVCLERMDESVTGILTVQCNHSFHTACLAHWEDTTCPVCRFAQTPEATADNACFECQSQESLWICLICGHVGCGRYVERHAFAHFQETNHTYAMQLNNNRVWDYAGDNYVHRLVQNKSDGKMVEVDERGNVVEDEKLDSIALEYAYLVNTQMESQRHYFEDKIMHIEKDAFSQIEQLELKNKQMREQFTETEKKLSVVGKEKQSVDKKYSQLNTKLSKLQSRLDEEKELNRGLQENQSQWVHKVKSLEESLQNKDEEIQELRDQLRDVMFYLEAGQKLANSTEVSQEEIQQGQVVVGASPSASHSGRKTRKKGR